MNAENSGGEPDNSANSEAPEAAEEELDKGVLRHLDQLMGSLNGQMDDIEGRLDSHKQELLQTIKELKEAQQKREEAAKAKETRRGNRRNERAFI
ncbi:hypothetical protein AAVH_24523 [Aphelenchoides avenae]|nr:hypothetical protein AAVH_24523 [Aphelenchus avenae]